MPQDACWAGCRGRTEWGHDRRARRQRSSRARPRADLRLRTGGQDARLATGLRRTRHGRLRTPPHGTQRRDRPERPASAGSRPGVPRARRAQGGRDEVRPGPQHVRGCASRRHRRPVPGAAPSPAGLRSPDAGVEAGGGAREGAGPELALTLRGVRTAAGRGSLDRSGAPCDLGRHWRTRGGEDPVPGRRRGPRERSRADRPACVGDGPADGSIDMKALTAEIAERIREEVDYLLEAEHQTTAATAFAGDSEFVVPSVLTATPRVLVSQWLDGLKLNAVADWDEERRNAVGLSYVRFLFSAPHRAGVLHADPHPGNFLVLGDGRLGIVDWGLVAKLPDGLPEPMGRLIRTALHGNAEDVVAGLRGEGLLVGDVNPQDLLAYLGPFVEPARAEEFHFTRDWMRGQYERLMSESRTSDTVMTKLNVPPVYALIHRVWMGGIAVLSQLDVRARFADVLTEYLPGFAAR